MENTTDLSREILNEFLERWNIEKIKSMTLDEYVSVGNKDTFCQWLETKTKPLGSINGINSSKFGIYKRNKNTTPPKNMVNDSIYSWQRFYGESRNEAFENIKNEIIQIINYSERGEFEKIDDLHLTLFVRWKISYLYSNERLIPIFKKSVLHGIAEGYGVSVSNKTKNSDIQKLIIEKKPAHLSIYEYASDLYQKFGETSKNKTTLKKRKKQTRKSTKSRNTKSQQRKGARSYIASQKHNLLQEALRIRLENKYGKDKVVLEENYVDVKVLFPKKLYFYEVKSSSYASDCIREALGQILSYSHNDDDEREKHLFVAGQYEPNQDEFEYIEFIKDALNIKFDYISIALDK